MKEFTFAKLVKLGEHDEKYGTTYWGEPNEQVIPVKFNSMNENITAEDRIEAEEILLKTSGKGIDYHQLKKVKVVPKTEFIELTTDEGTASERTRVVERPAQTQLDRIEAKLDKLIGVQEEVESEVPDFLRTEDI